MQHLVDCNKHRTFASQNLVPWMSGLVTGLQNRARRFESARHLLRTQEISWVLFFVLTTIV